MLTVNQAELYVNTSFWQSPVSQVLLIPTDRKRTEAPELSLTVADSRAGTQPQASGSSTHSLGLQEILLPMLPSWSHGRCIINALWVHLLLSNPCPPPTPGAQGQTSYLFLEAKAKCRVAEVAGCQRCCGFQSEPHFVAPLHSGAAVWQSYHPTPGSPKPPM